MREGQLHSPVLSTVGLDMGRLPPSDDDFDALLARRRHHDARTDSKRLLRLVPIPSRQLEFTCEHSSPDAPQSIHWDIGLMAVFSRPHLYCLSLEDQHIRR